MNVTTMASGLVADVRLKLGATFGTRRRRRSVGVASAEDPEGVALCGLRELGPTPVKVGL